MADVQLTQEETNRRTSPQFNGFRSWVVKELNRRKMEYPMQSVTPFVRFTSCQSDLELNYAYFTLGLHGFHAEDLNIFDASYGGRDIVGYAVDLKTKIKNKYAKRLIATDDLTEGAIPPAISMKLSPEANTDYDKFTKAIKDDLTLNLNTAHPVPGVTDIAVTRRDLGAPMTVQVTWVCYNRAQLEFLRNHFMTAGRYVVVEWGNQHVQKHVPKVLDFSDFPNITTELTNALRHGRKYVIDKWVRPNSGNYDFVVGTIGNFSIAFDPKTNIHTCTTTVYSMGENMWGIDLHKTVVRKESDEATSIASSFADFFKQGMGYDKLIELASKEPKWVAENQEIWDARAKTRAEVTPDLKNVSTNPLDHRYISWEFFAKNVMHRMYQSIAVEQLKIDTMQFLKFYDDEQFANDPEREMWVSDNKHLRSTDPEIMILIKKTMTGKIPTGFRGAGCFDEFQNGNEWRGKLSKGVWLNTGFIRTCFLEHNTFADAMKAVLTGMNNATANYWKLRLFFDEETNVYKIIDDHSVNTSMEVLPAFYKFNVGGTGETMGIQFDSAFPPELVTQMALFAQMKSASPAQQEELMTKYPTLGTTSTFMYSLNWTNLQDLVEQAYTKSLPKWTPNDDFDVTTIVPEPGKTGQSERVTARVTGGNATTGVAAMTATSPSGALTGKKISEKNFTIPQDTTIFIPRGKGSIRGTIAFRHNNPGNLTWANQPNATQGEPKEGGGHWARFKTPEDGFAALCRQIELEKARNLTAREMIFKYAPPSDGNDTNDYLDKFIKEMKCSRDTRVVAMDTVSMATVMIKQESSSSLRNGPPMVPYSENSIATMTQTETSTAIFGDPADKKNGGLNMSSGLSDTQEQHAKAMKEKAEMIINYFGRHILDLIDISPSVMRNRITRDGFLNYQSGSKGKPNPFVCPFPTTASITVTIQGISGISVSDGFYVDRLPFIFEKYGVFRVTTINERITTQGWMTEISGFFSMLFLNGEGLTHSAKTTALSHTR